MNQMRNQYSLRLTSFSVRNFRSLRDARVSDLPPVVLLYGDNDTGKSNLIHAVGVWLRIVQALAKATPQEINLRNISVDLYEGHESDWSDPPPSDGPKLEEILGKRPGELFRYGSDQFELEGEIALEAPADDTKRYQFGFRVSREYNGVFRCLVITAIWPSGRRETSESPPETETRPLRQALRSPWQQIGAERRFDDEQLPVGATDDGGTAIDPTGRNLKLQLFRAAHGFEASRRALFRERFSPLLTEQPFALPEPLPVVGVDGRVELLVGDYPVEHRGSGPQQWVLMAGLLAMSQATIAGLEEPEAHLSWEAQQRVAEVLGKLVLDKSYPPYQLFISSHSPLMLDMCSTDVYYETKLREGATHIDRLKNIDEFRSTRFFIPKSGPTVPRRLLAANLVRLSDEAVRHLGATPGEELIEGKEADGSLLLATAKWMDKYLAGKKLDLEDK